MTDRELLEVMYEDFKDMKEDIREIKKDVNGLKEDVNGLKEDVNGIKQDISCLKVKQLEHDHRFDHITNMMVKYDNHEVRIKDLESKVG